MRQTGWLQRMLAPLLFCICKIDNHIAEFFCLTGKRDNGTWRGVYDGGGHSTWRMRESALFWIVLMAWP